MPKNQTQMGDNERGFRTTRWSLISEIKNPDSNHSRTILNTLFRSYWKPIYYYIRSKGTESEKAKDLTQEFFCDILFEKNLFAQAQKSRGKFRSLLLTALNNFLISRNRYQSAQKRASVREIINIDLLDTLSCSEPIQRAEGQEDFHYSWVTSLLDNVVKKVKEQYCEKGKNLHWIAFDKRFWEPTINDSPAPSLTQLCKEYDIENEVKASNMVTSVKRCFQKMLRCHIREYVYTDNEVDEELSELLAFLRKYVQD